MQKAEDGEGITNTLTSPRRVDGLRRVEAPGTKSAKIGPNLANVALCVEATVAATLRLLPTYAESMDDAPATASKPRIRAQFRKPRVRLNFSRNVAGAAATGDGPKTKPYMQGYDRELDSEDDETGEGMAFEEQLILRVPDGPGENGELDELRRIIRRRGEYNDVWFKFKDSRRAVFHIGKQLYAAKLVDLPCIVESHKTLDNKQIFKIADISQMLLIERPIAHESEAIASTSATKNASNDEYIYPHGITPPMTWARKRRFRKRIHNQSIDTVEKEVEGLLNDDKRAERVEYEFIDPELADQIEQEIAQQKLTAESNALDSDDEKHDDDDAMSSHAGGDDAGLDGDFDDDENVDQDLAAELDAALAREQGDMPDDDEDDDTSTRGGGDRASDDAQSMGDSDLEDLWDDDDDNEDDVEAEVEASKSDKDEDDKDDEDDGEEEAERRVRESQLEAECREIEVLIKRKQNDVESTMNALLKSRHQQALRKLQAEHDAKKRHLGDIKQLRRTIREERAAEAARHAAAATAAAAAAGATASSTSASAPASGTPAPAASATPGTTSASTSTAQGAAEAAPEAESGRKSSSETPSSAS
ncbi:transcription initiation factor tfiid 55 kda subunit [Malassezia pachydermatis]|uniref:Transcription initiation factor tfiid 55 kDa subunit n=1 Tax=Malassezia pachydermatis TaxID=77020 RepID=A0A0M8MVX0_9BASI|nr:transcription initiation factor tfiid 55 kda subunit [Malassezia pachydermatis]KOS14850.1 transcription initiation factor tfiid 55 kda subunit [Malassezia pachydermatis]